MKKILFILLSGIAAIANAQPTNLQPSVIVNVQVTVTGILTNGPGTNIFAANSDLLNASINWASAGMTSAVQRIAGGGFTNLGPTTTTWVDGDGRTNRIESKVVDGDWVVRPAYYGDEGGDNVGTPIIDVRQNNVSIVANSGNFPTLNSSQLNVADRVTAPNFGPDADTGFSSDGALGIFVRAGTAVEKWDFKVDGCLIPTSYNTNANIGSSNAPVKINGVKTYVATLDQGIYAGEAYTNPPVVHHLFVNTLGATPVYTRHPSIFGMYNVQIPGGFETNKTIVTFGQTQEWEGNNVDCYYYWEPSDNSFWFISKGDVEGGNHDNMLRAHPIKIEVYP